ncbi:MAG TPA: TRIC cation channel family protein [Acidimicrobiales bacterium]|nr:TRIC cation channel family protein [Acidimicrobiales bacterium]
MIPSFDPTLVLWLNLVGTFVFGLSGGLAGVKARLDLFGVVVLAGVVGLAGGVTRDVLIGVAPATFRDWRYLAAVGAAGVVCFVAGPLLERVWRGVQMFDAVGLAVFCVAGASKAVEFKLGPAQAIILGAITGIGGGMLRDVLLGQVPTVLRHDLYAIPALLGAGVVVAAHAAGSSSALFPPLGAAVCFATRMVGLHFGVDLPIAPSERRRVRHDE